MLLGTQPKAGSYVGNRDTARVRPSALMNSQHKVLEQGFKAVMGNWVSCKPVSLCSNPEHCDLVTTASLMPSSW